MKAGEKQVGYESGPIVKYDVPLWYQQCKTKHGKVQ